MEAFKAKLEVEFEEQGLKAAQLDGLGESVEKASLVAMIQEEVRSAQRQIKECTEAIDKIKLRGGVMGGLHAVSFARQKLEQHKILLEWIERQHQEMARECPHFEKEGNQGQLRALRNRHAANRSSKANGHNGKQSTARSILSPFTTSKVSKAPRKTQSRRQTMSVMQNAFQAEKATATPRIPENTSRPTSKVKDIMFTALRRVHSSRVSKPSSKKRTGLRPDGMIPPPMTDGYQKRGSMKLDMSSAPPARRKATPRFISATTPPRPHAGAHKSQPVFKNRFL